MRINTNITALKGYNSLNKVTELKAKSLERLTSGKRINSAADDAAGMSISTKMTQQIKGMKMAVRNTQDGQGMTQTAEGALGEVSDILTRARELSVQAANDTYSDAERQNIEAEITELTTQIEKIATDTKFNGTELLTGGVTLKIQTGANKGEELEITFTDLKNVNDTLVGNIDLSDAEKAQDTIESLDTAIKNISDQRSTLGSTINRLDYTISNLNTAIENLSAAESRVSDVDMASEMMEMTKNNILSQAGISMLSQSMQLPNGVLQLLQQ